MINFEEFISAVEDSTKKAGYTCRVAKISKNNRVLTGASISANASSVYVGACTAAPTIYLEEHYDMLQRGERLEAVISRILEIAEESQVTEEFDVNFFSDYGKVADKLTLRLIGTDNNDEYLKDKLVKKVCDHLVAVPYIELKFNGQPASVAVTKQLREGWLTNEEEIFRQAAKNLPKKGLYFESLGGYIMGIDDFDFPDEMPLPRIFIVSNETKSFGAAAILDPDVRSRIASVLGEEFYIVPSSVHELLVMAPDQISSPEEMVAMISEVNDTQVEPQERLSYHLFRCRNGMIECVL